MTRKLINILRQPDESDLCLCIGIEAVFYGAYLIYPPASFIIIGLVFCGLAYLSAQEGGAHGVA